MCKERLMNWLDDHQAEFETMEKDIWDHPETALNEVYASTRQKEYLKEKGFRIKEVEGVSTGFVAECGSGKPVIALLGEYDALPDMSQKVQTVQEAQPGHIAGHACGHNLIGTGALAAAEAVKVLMEAEKLDGTVRYYGCPAEERYSGKIRMQKQGVFRDADISLIWHPQDISGISKKQYYCSLAMVTAEFSGETGHSMAAKRYGGSAPQAAQLMMDGVNSMREYIWDYHRLHAYTEGTGKTANLLPEKTTVYCEVRANSKDVLMKIKDRLGEIAEGAAKMAGTAVSCGIEEELYNDLENSVILEQIESNLGALPKETYTEEEKEFAAKLAATLPEGAADKVTKFYSIPKEDIQDHLHTGVVSRDNLIYLPADDAGNVSWEVPFGTFLMALPPVGMPMHCWQMTALSGSSLGLKAMMRAAKVMAMTAYDFLKEPQLVKEARTEFQLIK